MMFRALFTTTLSLSAWALALPALGQVPGGSGDLSSHVDIGVDPDSGQLVFGFTGIQEGTPLVLKDGNFIPSVPGGGGGFVNVQFTAEQDVAFRTASNAVASGFGFNSFSQFGTSTPQIAAEAVDFDPFFESAVQSSFILDPGDFFVLNGAGKSIDVHPFYFVASDDPDFIGRVRGR
ncbi:MAG: hypothetical protein AAGL98_16580 [Planctomycetota bacterium]